LNWIFDRCVGRGEAIESPIGWLPAPGAIPTEGLDLDPAALEAVMSVNPLEWQNEIPLIAEYYASFGDRAPAALYEELNALDARLSAATAQPAEPVRT
jgi:phosphoenolpyruvate carboxykinase (GTP)